jgi:hypothetical protein
MAIEYSLLFDPKQVNNAAADTLFTIPAAYPSSTILRNGRVRFANTSGAAVTIEVWAVPDGDTAANDNKILPTYSIPANSYIDLDLPYMGLGAMLQAKAGAATSITASFINGFLQS